RIEAPYTAAACCIVGIDEAASAVFTAGDTDYHLVLHDQRGHVECVCLAVVCGHDIPADVACLRIERDHVRVEGGHEQPVANHGGTQMDLLGQRSLVAPYRASGPCIYGERTIVLPGTVKNTVDEQRRGLELPELCGLKCPFQAQVGDVAGVDLIQGAVAQAGV